MEHLALHAVSYGDFETELRQNFGLTKAQARICLFIRRGLRRSEILRLQGIESITLRRHLNQIYKKTITKADMVSGARDKLQRLTVFLSRFESNEVGRVD